MLQRFRRHLPVLITAVVVATATAVGPSVAQAAYDAVNANHVDGKDAVGSGASAAHRAGKLVATNASGKFPTKVLGVAPNSRRLGGFSHGQVATMSIPPQAAFVSSGATAGSSGPTFAASGDGVMTVGFVVPPDRGKRPLAMRVVYREDSTTACQWYVAAQGLEGPDGPNSTSNIHNGGWKVPGTNNYSGLISVPAGLGNAHTAMFEWPFQSDPGMFIQFALARNGGDPADTCQSVTIMGLELLY